MNQEKNVFKRYIVDFKKLEKYGFKKIEEKYIYEKEFLNNNFKAIITINKEGNIFGKVIDLQDNDEYFLINMNIEGKFVNKVRDNYQEILIDIRNNCFNKNNFIFNQTNRICNYIVNKYHNYPEFLWDKTPGCGVFRNNKNNKWYAIIMNIDQSKLENKKGEVEVINIKHDDVDNLLKKKGIYKAYHMNKKEWVSIILNNTLPDDEILSLIDVSYNLINDSKIWIIPANPKYYDVINCFNNDDEILWNQKDGISIGDIVYIYVTAPYKQIMYKCLVTSVDIEHKYEDKNVKIDKMMKIKLIENLKNNNYNWSYLNDLGITLIRGPRKISKQISQKL